MKITIDKRKRVVIYVRVSSHEQVEDGNSLVTQERLCREYCEKHNLEVAIVYVERGESAKTANRTELKKLLEFCSNKKNEISGLIIYKIDRLSRNTDDYSQLRILMKKYEVEIISITEKFEDTPVGRFIENTMSNVAQFDNDIRTERSVNGMKQSILEGRYTFRPPVGYERIVVDKKNDITPCKRNAKYIIRIFELANKGFGTLEEVRQQVIKEGLLLDTGKAPCKQHFYDILRNKLYIGIIEKFGEERPGLFETVLKDKQLFWEVQKILKNNGIKSKTRELDNPDFPLRRFVFKPDMSKPITGGVTTTKYVRYPKYTFPGKGSTGILNTELHNLFSKFMDEYAIPKKHFTKLKSSLFTKFNVATIDQRKAIGKASDKLKELQERETKLVNKNLDGLISDDVFKRQMESLQSDIYKSQQQMRDINDTTYNFEELLELAENYLTKPSSVWNSNITIDQKIKLQWCNFPKGITFDGKSLCTSELSLLHKTFLENLDTESTMVSVGRLALPTLAL